MTPTLEALGIDRLSVAEKLELIARIWESLPPDAVPEMPAVHLANLKRRLARPAAVNDLLDRNWNLALAINEEARLDPQSPYAEKYVGIANGQVVVVTDDLDELDARLMQAQTGPWSTFSFRAGVNPTPLRRPSKVCTMPRVEWPLRHGRPTIEVVLTQAANGQPLCRHLLADTAAGDDHVAL